MTLQNARHWLGFDPISGGKNTDRSDKPPRKGEKSKR